MSHAKRASKRRRRSKTGPVLGAAGLSLSLASGASAATAGPAADMPTPSSEASHEITLAEEEICDVTLATFYVFDRENGGTFQPRIRFAVGCGCGCAIPCWTATMGTGDTNPPQQAVKPAHKYKHARKRKRTSKKP